jgi:hypothetical protein
MAVAFRHSPDPPQPQRVALRAQPCICDKHMLERDNEGTCLWCGHGNPRPVSELAYRRNQEGNRPVLGLRLSSAADARVIPIRRARSHEWDEDKSAMAALAQERKTGKFPTSTQWNQARERGEHRPSYVQVKELFGSWKAFKDYCADVPRESVA